MSNIKPRLSNIERIHCQAEPYFESMLDAIDRAQFSIDMEAYIFEVFGIGEKISRSLAEAAQRGVQVRLLTDGAGVDSRFASIANMLSAAGVEVRIHHPFPWQLKHWSFSLVPGNGLAKLWYLLSYINKRNHRKMLIVDHKHLWLGSFNISNKHLPKNLGGENWRDTAIELHQSNTLPARLAFNANWNRWKRKQKKIIVRNLRHSSFLFNFTRRLRLRHRQLILARMQNARTRIWITNAYFVPDNKLLNCLVAAGKNNVDVRILLPKTSDIFFVPWLSAYFYQQLISSGIKIYEYDGGFLHAKTMLIDDWSTVGSSNFNRRSLLHDLEVDYIVQHENNVQRLEQEFLKDIELSSKLSLSGLRNHKRWQRWLGGILLVLIGYWV